MAGKSDRRLEEAEKSSKAAEKLVDLGSGIKAEEEKAEKRAGIARYTGYVWSVRGQIAESENAELSEEEVAEQLKGAAEEGLGDTISLARHFRIFPYRNRRSAGAGRD